MIKGRCHMEYCSFTQVLSIREVARGPIGTLLEVQQKSASIKAPLKDGAPEYEQVPVPTFEGDVVTHLRFAQCNADHDFLFCRG